MRKCPKVTISNNTMQLKAADKKIPSLSDRREVSFCLEQFLQQGEYESFYPENKMSEKCQGMSEQWKLCFKTACSA